MLGTAGIVAMAALILVSISLHEAGHMGTAKAFGMRVTRYFVGFGPTIWSTRKGETEYGVKAVPLGGFVRIVGMTAQDEDADDPRAMWRFPVWKRTIVMAAGSIVHFILAFLLLWGVTATAALPNPDNLGPNATTTDAWLQQPAFITPACVPAEGAADCTGTDGPAAQAGLQEGDRVTAIGGAPVDTYGDLVTAVRGAQPDQPLAIEYVRDGATATTELVPVGRERAPVGDENGAKQRVAVVGVSLGYDPALPRTVEYSAVEALPVSVDKTGELFVLMGDAVKKFPEKIPLLWTAITGGERDPETPISVVGASRLGGELVETDNLPAFFMMLAVLNLFIGLFNLLPLLPLDGGHIAISWFEKARSWVYARLRRPDPGRVDYYKLAPVTYVVILIFGAFTLLTVTADIVNPITIFK